MTTEHVRNMLIATMLSDENKSINKSEKDEIWTKYKKELPPTEIFSHIQDEKVKLKYIELFEYINDTIAKEHNIKSGSSN